MPRIETVKIKSDAHPSGYIIVNKEDAHKYEEKPKQEAKPKAQSKRAQKKSGDE